MFYRIKIERVEPPTAESVREYGERSRYGYQQNNMPPMETVLEALVFECGVEQFNAIRIAALESMQ